MDMHIGERTDSRIAGVTAFGAALMLGALPAQDALAQAACQPTQNISAIQGNSTTQLAGGAHNDVSPLVTQVVTLEGIVVADFQSIPQSTRAGELRGFFLEEEGTDHDADSTTSEGLFVFTGNAPALDVQEGQKVCVTGPVSEFFGMTQVTATAAGSLALVAASAPLPDPALLHLPVIGDLNDHYEQHEGMRVQFADVLHVSEYFEVARYGQVVLTADSRPFQYTHDDTSPTAAEYSSFLDALARRRIILDDDNNTQNAPLPAGVFFHPRPDGLAIGTQGVDFFRGGDTVHDLTGVLHWSFAGQAGTDVWRIRPTLTSPVVFSVANARPAQAPGRRGDIRIATFNVLNYFSTIDTTSSTTTGPCGPSGTLDCRGADSATEFDRQNEKLIAALKAINADVFGLVEIENNGSAPTPAVAELVARLNTSLGTTTYQSIDTGVVGTDAITVAIVYKPAVVRPRGAASILTDGAFVDPNATGLQRNRPAIAQTFQVIGGTRPDRGQSFTVVVNHLKSKSPDGATGADVDQLDGQAAWNDTRTRAADYLVNSWIPSDPTGQSDPDFLIIGDLNAYRGETPISTLRNAGYRDLHRIFEGADAYSFVFDGQLGYLDHALANASMTQQVACVATWPINSDEAPVFDYNDTVRDAGEASFEAEPTGNALYEANQVRTSDHDPIVVDVNLCPAHGQLANFCRIRNAFAQLACVAAHQASPGG
jgi:predicted extracellular nuclease